MIYLIAPDARSWEEVEIDDPRCKQLNAAPRMFQTNPDSNPLIEKIDGVYHYGGRTLVAEDLGNAAARFEIWMRRVDTELRRVSGLTSIDLADMPYRDWFDDGADPKDAARDVLENEGFPFVG